MEIVVFFNCQFYLSKNREGKSFTNTCYQTRTLGTPEFNCPLNECFAKANWTAVINGQLYQQWANKWTLVFWDLSVYALEVLKQTQRAESENGVHLLYIFYCIFFNSFCLKVYYSHFNMFRNFIMITFSNFIKPVC